VPISIIFAYKVSLEEDRRYVIGNIIGIWILFGFLISFINDWMPFTQSGDDIGYFHLADPPIDSIAKAIDLSRYKDSFEQPGYSWILSLLNGITGHDLVVYKLLNLFFLISLSLVWYRIGIYLESRRYARKIMIVILFLSPLWYYMLFLYKDMAIALIQSIFIYASIRYWISHDLKSILMIIITSIFILIFRSPLIIQNGLVLLSGLIIRGYSEKKINKNRYIPLFVFIVITIGIGLIVTNSEYMVYFGIFSAQRVIGTVEMREGGLRLAEASQMNRSLFPLIYLFSETSGFSSRTWLKYDSTWVRGILALPWILFLVPFFLLGVNRFIKYRGNMAISDNIFNGLNKSNIMVTPWSLIVIYIIASASISWIVGDTTRWRISDMPMIASIAIYGWIYTSENIRKKILIWWVAIVSVLITIYYL
jgi:hypothetical protein